MAIAVGFPFTKMHGSGNDFIVIDQTTSPVQIGDISAFALAVCRRGMSIGADGVILIETSDEADFSWRYINADGSDGEMCGNGAMVGARFAVEHGIASSPCTFTTPAGVVQASVEGESVTLGMMDAIWRGGDLRFTDAPGVVWDRFSIGVPHVVGVVEDADAFPELDRIGRAIRHDPQLRPAGANVNIIQRIDDHTLRMRTYERGVEAETLACGTGAVCSAFAAVRRGLVEQPVDVVVSSGLRLRVAWRTDGDTATSVSLRGIARVVAQGDILPDALI